MRTMIENENKKIKSIVLTEEFAIDDENGDKFIFEPGDEIDIVYNDAPVEDDDIDDYEVEDFDDGVPEPVDSVNIDVTDPNSYSDVSLDVPSLDSTESFEDDYSAYDDESDSDEVEVSFDEYGNPIV